MPQLALVAVMSLVGSVAWADGPPLRQSHVTTLENQLHLDGRDAERVQSIVDKYTARMAPLQRADVEIIGQLRTQLALTVPDARRLRSLSGDLVKNRQRLQSLRDDRLRELQKTLTPEQFSRLIVRWSALTRQFRREARRARRG
jgi:Spy/CpxP family protein refolding chaperone